MTAERTTPAIERAAEALVLEEGTLDYEVLTEPLREAPRDTVRAILTAALSDPDDPDYLARTLWHLHRTAVGWATTPEAFENVTTPPSRDIWRAVADGLRSTLVGDGS